MTQLALTKFEKRGRERFKAFYKKSVGIKEKKKLGREV